VNASMNTLAAIWESSMVTHAEFASYEVLVGEHLAARRDAGRKYGAASVIKTALLALLLQDVAAARFDWKEVTEVTDEHTAGGDGLLRAIPLPVSMRVCDIATLMIAASDNTAANVILDILGGPDAVNHRLAAMTGSPILRGWFSSRGRTAKARAELLSDAALPSPAGVAVMSVTDYTAVIEHVFKAPATTGAATGQLQRFLHILELQLDRRSLARHVREGVPFAHKSGTVQGLRHDAGMLSLGEQVVTATVFTDGRETDDALDHPACRGMGQAMAWTLLHLGRDDLVTFTAPPLADILLGPLDLLSEAEIAAVFREKDIAASLRSQEREVKFWLQSRREQSRRAWTIIRGGSVVGFACLYRNVDRFEALKYSIGIYVIDPSERGHGIGRAACKLLLDVAKARSIRELVWETAASNAASLALARVLGFTEYCRRADVREVGGMPVDEVELRLRLDR
jgi:beta-lactamase class A